MGNEASFALPSPEAFWLKLTLLVQFSAPHSHQRHRAGPGHRHRVLRPPQPDPPSPQVPGVPVLLLLRPHRILRGPQGLPVHW